MQPRSVLFASKVSLNVSGGKEWKAEELGDVIVCHGCAFTQSLCFFSSTLESMG